MLLCLEKLNNYKDLGNEVIIIIGDFTGMIGDPTGKSKTKKTTYKRAREENARTYQSKYLRY